MLVRQGLRPRLAGANLLTGQKQISIDVVRDAPPAEVEIRDGVVIMPTAP